MGNFHAHALNKTKCWCQPVARRHPSSITGNPDKRSVAAFMQALQCQHRKLKCSFNYLIYIKQRKSVVVLNTIQNDGITWVYRIHQKYCITNLPSQKWYKPLITGYVATEYVKKPHHNNDDECFDADAYNDLQCLFVPLRNNSVPQRTKHILWSDTFVKVGFWHEA